MKRTNSVNEFMLSTLLCLLAISCQVKRSSSNIVEHKIDTPILASDSSIVPISGTPILLEMLRINARLKHETFDFSAPYPIFDKSKIDDLSYLKQLCVDSFLKYEGSSTSNIKALKKIWEGQLFRIGFCKVYDLELIDVPMAAEPSTTVIVNMDKSLMYRLNLQKLDLSKIQDSLPPIFSGRYFFRGGGAFYSYYVVNDTLYNFFESELVTKVCYDYSCTCYKDNHLKFDNIDIDGDGYRDLQFSGWEYDYCTVYGSRREDDKTPGDSTFIKRTYFLRKKKEHFYYLRIDSLSVPVITNSAK